MLERVFKWAKIQCEVADSMTATWSKFVPKWSRMLGAYKKNSSMPNLFKEPNPGEILLYRHIIVN